MGYIFVSYSHKDKEYVHKLHDDLENEGFEVWIDDRIDFGDEWPMVIQEKLDSCDAFILVASENAYASKWVQKEVTRAQRINKPFFQFCFKAILGYQLNQHSMLMCEEISLWQMIFMIG